MLIVMLLVVPVMIGVPVVIGAMPLDAGGACRLEHDHDTYGHILVMVVAGMTNGSGCRRGRPWK